ncbi:MAG: hypothetical protein Q6352_016895 [Candidatus Freyrarchaeum guaymaensis]|nr:hypothetical protein [Candidatus Sigynarchaeota archaeon]
MGERPTGVTILAILMIIWGILVLISGFISLGAFILFPTGLEAIMPIIDIIWGILYIIGGAGLLSLKEWARILAIIINILGLIGGILLTITIAGAIIGIPMIVISIIIIWYLWKEETAAYFS